MTELNNVNVGMLEHIIKESEADKSRMIFSSDKVVTFG